MLILVTVFESGKSLLQISRALGGNMDLYVNAIVYRMSLYGNGLYGDICIIDRKVWCDIW